MAVAAGADAAVVVVGGMSDLEAVVVEGVGAAAVEGVVATAGAVDSEVAFEAGIAVGADAVAIDAIAGAVAAAGVPRATRVAIDDGPTTRQIMLPTSSATSRPPPLSIATPTGRPQASPSGLRKPFSTSTGGPDGLAPLNGTKITL